MVKQHNPAPKPSNKPEPPAAPPAKREYGAACTCGGLPLEGDGHHPTCPWYAPAPPPGKHRHLMPGPPKVHLMLDSQEVLNIDQTGQLDQAKKDEHIRPMSFHPGWPKPPAAKAEPLPIGADPGAVPGLESLANAIQLIYQAIDEAAEVDGIWMVVHEMIESQRMMIEAMMRIVDSEPGRLNEQWHDRVCAARIEAQRQRIVIRDEYNARQRLGE